MTSVPGSPVHVEFRRSGGFAGISLTAATSTDTLTGEHAAQVRDLLARPEAQPRQAAPGGVPSPGPDRFQYHLRLDDGQRQRAFSWNETQVPDEVRPLLSELTRLAHPG